MGVCIFIYSSLLHGILFASLHHFILYLVFFLFGCCVCALLFLMLVTFCLFFGFVFDQEWFWIRLSGCIMLRYDLRSIRRGFWGGRGAAGHWRTTILLMNGGGEMRGCGWPGFRLVWPAGEQDGRWTGTDKDRRIEDLPAEVWDLDTRVIGGGWKDGFVHSAERLGRGELKVCILWGTKYQVSFFCPRCP